MHSAQYGTDGKRAGSSGGDVFSAQSAESKVTGPSLVTSKNTIKHDEETKKLIKEGVEFLEANKKNGTKQVYLYPEDLSGPNARADPRCQKCGTELKAF